MRVLSLFDGIGGAREALSQLGVTPEKYFASEIDTDCIAVASHNHPDIIQLGKIENLQLDQLDCVDLVIGGSPCQGFSYAGKGLNFNDTRSKLLFNFADILHKLPFCWFLLENVNMKQEWQNIISDLLGTAPILLNSSLLVPQSRPRLYWTNIPFFYPQDTNRTIQEIVGKKLHPAAMRGRRINRATNTRADHNKNIPIQQYIEWRKDNRSNCLTTVQKDNILTTYKSAERKLATEVQYSYYTPEQYEELQGFPKGYSNILSDTKRFKVLGNAFTVPIISHIIKPVIYW